MLQAQLPSQRLSSGWGVSLTPTNMCRSYRLRAHRLLEPTLLWAHHTQVQSESPKNCMETWGLVQFNLPHAEPGPVTLRYRHRSLEDSGHECDAMQEKELQSEGRVIKIVALEQGPLSGRQGTQLAQQQASALIHWRRGERKEKLSRIQDGWLKYIYQTAHRAKILCHAGPSRWLPQSWSLCSTGTSHRPSKGRHRVL